MSGRKALLIVCAVVVLTAAIALLAAPLITATAVKLWIAQFARQNGCSISYAGIDAPFLRPVTLHDVKIAAANGAIAVKISRVEADLRIAALLDSSRGRPLRSLSLIEMQADCRVAPSPQALQGLLADSFSISVTRLAIHSPAINVDVYDAALSANELQPGTFRARRLVAQSPALQQAFDDLRGGTSWEYNRLTIGGVTLMHDLDLDVLRIDLARARENRIRVEADLDVFGGKLRASMSAEEETGKPTWEIAASGSEISLARMSDALEFSNRTSGSLHAFKFTFRGNLSAIADATASLWTEMSGFTWRDRTADVVMLGASYYNGGINVEQLYVKQRQNELTLSGDFALPQRAGDLPDLRGDLSATIGDLADFARLFGGSPADFAGQLAVNGNARAQERSLAGELVLSGKSLKVFGAPIDAIDAHVSLSRATLELDHCEVRRESAGLPPLSIRATCDFSDRNAVSARFEFDQPLVAAPDLSGCVSEVRLGDPVAAQPTDSTLKAVEFDGPLFRTGWTVTLRGAADESAKTFPFCAQSNEPGGALVIAPIR